MPETLYDQRAAQGLAVLEALAVEEAVCFAAQVRQLAELTEWASVALHDDGVDQFLVIDVAGSLRIGQLAATSRLEDDRRLTQVLTGTLEGLSDGSVLVAQARLLLAETRNCSEQVAAEVERRVLAMNGPDGLRGWTAKRLRSRLKAEILAVEALLEPGVSEQRESDAVARRRVSLGPEPDGMGSLWALLPAEQLHGFAVGLDELTRRQAGADRDAGVKRTADQRRADLLAMLPALALHALDGTAPAGCVPAPGSTTACGAGACGARLVLNVHVPMATVLGLSGEPGHLEGYGPVSAFRTRLLLPQASLRRVLVDQHTGQPLHVEQRLRSAAGSPAAAHQQLLDLLGPEVSPASASAPPRAAASAQPSVLPSAPAWAPGSAGPSARSWASGSAGPSAPASAPASASGSAGPSAPRVPAASARRRGAASSAGEAPRGPDSAVDGRLGHGRASDPAGAVPGDLPGDGYLVVTDVVEPQYVPSAALTRLVRVRDLLCTAPGCATSSARCDLDHERPWPVGPTAAWNLGPKSRRCHRAKTLSWAVARHPDGSHTWTSPTGRTYPVPPPWRPPPLITSGAQSAPLLPLPPGPPALESPGHRDTLVERLHDGAATPAPPPDLAAARAAAAASWSEMWDAAPF